MAYNYSELIKNIEDWTTLAVNKGWISKECTKSLVDEESKRASSLFTQQTERPLVVAFMGGTGVGKSSLLNKLAAQSIAKTGVERPTSHEVTLYHHQSVSIQQLVEKFPTQKIKISSHTQANNEKILWIDMPDFDSTEAKNKAIVLQWLPYVDVLIYVVSPERYKDQKVWQLLLAQGASHAWLFVMNQWDKGETVQYHDFEQQLAKAGFKDPLIYQTICSEQSNEPLNDQFASLKSTIESLITEKAVRQLENRAEQQYNHHIKQKLQQYEQLMGDEQALIKLLEHHRLHWSEIEKAFTQGFAWSIKQAALILSKTGITGKQETIQLWDDWAKGRLDDYLDTLILVADQNGIPYKPLSKGLVDSRQKAAKIVKTQTELACRQTLANPGSALQRIGLKIANICELVLPLVAMAIVGFQIFQGYYDSSFSEQDFLGINFAVHSILLILICWLLPYFIRKKMQPSLEKAALKGLNKGLDIAEKAIASEIKQSIETIIKQHQSLIVSLNKLIKMSDEQNQKVFTAPKSEQLLRMLVANTDHH